MKNDLQAILKKTDLKVTPARLLILEVFSLCLCKPINAEDIYKKLKGKDMNLVTIYRTLSSLEKGGILKRIDLRKGSAYYELTDHHHHHIVCTSCGVVEGFSACNIGSVTRKALAGSKKFNSIQDHSIELLGVCKTCVKS